MYGEIKSRVHNFTSHRASDQMIGGGGVSQTSNTFSSLCRAKSLSPPIEKSQMAPPWLRLSVDVSTYSGPLNTEMLSFIDEKSWPPCLSSPGTFRFISLLRELQRTPPAPFRRSRNPRSSYWLITHTERSSSMAMAWSTRLSSCDAAAPASDHDQTTFLPRKSSRPMKQLSALGNSVATINALPLELVGVAQRASGWLVEEVGLLAGGAVPHADAVLVEPPLAAGEDARVLVERQRAGGEGLGLAAVRDAEAVAELAGDGGEGGHPAVVALAEALARRDEERGGVEVGRVVDLRVVERDRAALVEHPVVDAHGAAVRDAASAVWRGADGRSVPRGAPGNGRGEAEAVAVEGAPTRGADVVEEAVVERLAVEELLREVRRHVEAARAEEVEQHREARRVAYSATAAAPSPEEEEETFQEESSRAPSMESRPALASVVVVVSNTCPPTLNRTRPPPAITGAALTESKDLYTVPAWRSIRRLPTSDCNSAANPGGRDRIAALCCAVRGGWKGGGLGQLLLPRYPRPYEFAARPRVYTSEYQKLPLPDLWRNGGARRRRTGELGGEWCGDGDGQVAGEVAWWWGGVCVALT
nr:unnamed protein product [Digitaria exilis]